MVQGGGHAGFADIEFGYADAEKESAENPDLLLRAFLDDTHVVDKALVGDKFLFLGYKGSGKTAIAERASLLQQERSELFVTVEHLTDFSYLEFKNATGGAGDYQTRYPTTWAYLLLLSLLKSLDRDEGGKANAPSEYSLVVESLADLGLTPVPKLAELVKRSSKTMTKGGIKGFLERSVEKVQEAPDLRMAQVVGVLQECVSCFATRSRHVVFLDGLDAIVSQRDLQFQSLAALMAEANRLNNFFRRNNNPFKFVVLCRTDIFDRLPGANTNKIRQDSGMELDWYDDPRQPQRTRLVRLVNLRARHSLRRTFDVFDEYFPSRINDRAIRSYLLNHTRHTPRDILQLMRRIQAHADGPGKLMPVQVKSGVRDYSNNYFISEVRNELAGYVGNDEIEQAVTLLTTLDKPEFRLHELRNKADTLGYKTLDVNALASALFNCNRHGRP